MTWLPPTFIKGEAYIAEQKYKEAKKVFRIIIRKYRFAQCWDPAGWFWKVAEAAEKRIEEIGRFQSLGF